MCLKKLRQYQTEQMHLSCNWSFLKKTRKFCHCLLRSNILSPPHNFRLVTNIWLLLLNKKYYISSRFFTSRISNKQQTSWKPKPAAANYILELWKAETQLVKFCCPEFKLLKSWDLPTAQEERDFKDTLVIIENINKKTKGWRKFCINTCAKLSIGGNFYGLWGYLTRISSHWRSQKCNVGGVFTYWLQI